jgi:drug/metabolite transporter (DMT)-like permease
MSFDFSWHKLISILLVNAATFSWATNIVLGRWLRDDVGPLTISAARYVVASLLFWFLLRRRPEADRRVGQDRWWLLGMALTGVVFFGPTIYLGLRYTTAVNATLMNGVAPLTTGLLSVLLIGEAMSRRQMVAAFIGLAGLIILITGGSLAFFYEIHSSVGDLIVLGGMTLWGLYSVLGRQAMRGRSALSATALSAFMGLPILVLAAAWEMQYFPLNARPEVLAALVYIGIAPTVIGILSWNIGVRRLGPTGAMVFFNTLPLYGALLGVLFLGETLGWPHLIGGGLIIGGGIWGATRG